MKKLVFTLFILSCSVTLAFSAPELNIENDQLNPLQTSIPSLSIAPDSRAGGMGDVGAATTPDINSQYWNPAKYPRIKEEAGFSLSYTPWLRKLVSDIDLAYLAGYWKFDEDQAVSASLRYFSLGDVILRQTLDDSGITVNPNEFAIDVAYSRLLSEKWSGAVAMRYIRSDLTGGISTGTTDIYAANAVAADIAAFYTTPVTLATGNGNFALGFNVSNIGTKVSYDDGVTSDFLPTNLRLGGSFDYPFDEYNKMMFTVDLNKLLVPTKNDMTDEEYNEISPISGIFMSFNDAPRGFEEEMEEVMWSAGVEYSYLDQFFVRGGYFNEAANKGNRKYFTAGAGFKLNVFRLDAAYVISVAQSNPLDQTLRFTLSFDLNGMKSFIQ